MAGVAVTAVAVGVVLAATGGSGNKKSAVRTRRPELFGGGRGAARSTRGAGGVNGGSGAGGSVAGEPRGDLAAASAYLGISRAKLRKELSSGRSLAAVAATSPGHSTVGLLGAIMRPRVRRIDAQVAAKRISQAEAEARIARIRKRVQARLARSASYKPTVAIAEQYLGLAAAALRAQLHGGRTLLQLAGATPGKSGRGLIAAVMAVRVNELVHGAGGTSEATLRRETALLQALEQRVRRELQQGAPAVVTGQG
ncbi:MAG TPA: hypothetical protein VLZ06_10975 [Solirubrobacteraceae bacterium]|nr:hypothetical protein [Solirubrobacteraceae bacterium]